SGMPHNRMQRLQADFGIPLPASTQYEIVADASQSMVPAHEELQRQAAADGQVIHNDDTKAVILQVLRDRAAAERLSGGAKDKDGDDDDGRTGIFTTGVVSQLQEHRIILFFT